MLLARNGSVVTLTVGHVVYEVAPDLYRDWSAVLDEARRAHEAEVREAKWRADLADARAKAEAMASTVPGAWLVDRGPYAGVRRVMAVALGHEGRIVEACYADDKYPPLIFGGNDALLSAPADVWWRVRGGRLLHRFGDVGGWSRTLCNAAYGENIDVRGYRGPTKWKRCAKCEAKS